MTLDYIKQKFPFLDFNQKKMPIYIKEMGRLELATLFCELGFRTGVEIGVESGMYSEHLCLANPGLRLFSIDPYMYYPEPDVGSQDKQDKFYKWAQDRLSKFRNCTLVRNFSMNAVKDFNDHTLDFVYIDGNHHLKYVIEDIYEWSKKIRSGGILAGHDYIILRNWKETHVVAAVNAYTTVYKIRPWFLIGDRGKTNPKREGRRSFFWIIQ